MARRWASGPCVCARHATTRPLQRWMGRLKINRTLAVLLPALRLIMLLYRTIQLTDWLPHGAEEAGTE